MLDNVGATYWDFYHWLDAYTPLEPLTSAYL